MMNPIHVYKECGAKMANAYNKRDAALASFQRSWFNRAVKLESKENQILARATFDEGYKENRIVNSSY